MAWIYLLIAGLLEIGWAVLLKYTEGWTRLIPSLATLMVMGLSFAFLSLALKQISLGTAYAVWTGIGAVGTVLFGLIFLGESRDFSRLFFIFLIIIGVIGLKLSSK